ncbi:AAA family ATPase [Lactiplantibacillus plantarum]|uniref:AAA family ATPase n=1 Tax=Lactiplantibacillus plantarum TaxID=1590 RepID=UPI003C2A45DF
MKINKLSVESFRQFYDPQEVKFAAGSKNVTLIIGANGAGKTGIFRAMIYGLYGHQSLQQDDSDSKVHLVNFKRLQENTGRPVSAKVSLKFENEGKTYQLVREIAEVMQGEKIQELGEKVSLLSQNESGETILSLNNAKDVAEFISSILPEEVRNFFFFDAENLQLLNDLSGKSSFVQIKQNIQDLLQISTLSRGAKVLHQLYHIQMNDISNQSGDPEIKKLSQLISDDKDTIKELKSQNDVNQKAISAANSEIDDLNKQLADNKRLQDEKKDIDAQEQIKNTALEAKKSILKNMTVDLEPFSAILSRDIFDKTLVQVKDMREKQRDVFAKQVLQQSLQNGKCMMCGNDLGKDPQAQKHVQQLLDNYHSSELSGILDLIEGANDRISEDYKRLPDKMNSNYQDLVSSVDKVQKAQTSIDKKMDLVSSNLEKINNLIDKEDHTLPKLKQDIQDKQFLITKNNAKIAQLVENLANNQKDRDTKIKKQNQLDVKRQIAEKTNHLETRLRQILNDYDSNARKELAHQVRVLFNQLVTGQDQHLIRQITISDNYDMQIIGDNGANLLNDISEGQKQVLSLAFIFALAKLASKGRKSEIDFPLFVDTPFARLDSQIRDHIIKETPKLSSQWVLLLTDTEYTNREKQSFVESNAVGTSYQLQKNNDGKTEIQVTSLI